MFALALTKQKKNVSVEIKNLRKQRVLRNLRRAFLRVRGRLFFGHGEMWVGGSPGELISTRTFDCRTVIGQRPTMRCTD